MAVDLSSLVRAWIQFLKVSQIASSDPDPKTGNQIYKRKVTASDVSEFLQNNTNYDADTINKVIMQVMQKSGKTGKSRDTAKLPNNTEEPAAQQKPRQLGHTPSKVGYDPNSISDIDYRDINEAFGESNLPDLSEDDVEAIFKALLSIAAPKSAIAATAEKHAKKKARAASNSDSEIPPEEAKAKKEEQIRKIKRVIRDTMTDNQRKALWRALNEV